MTEHDILCKLNDALCEIGKRNIQGDVLRCDIEAFPGGDYYGNKTHYAVHMVVDDGYALARAKFFMDDEYTVSTESDYDGKPMIQLQIAQ